MTAILGLNAFHADSAACLVIDNWDEIEVSTLIAKPLLDIYGYLTRPKPSLEK